MGRLDGQQDKVIAALHERGEPLPANLIRSLERQGNVWDISRPMWTCFWALAPSRPIVSTGMGAQYGRLPYQEISAWAKDHDHAETTEELDDFVTIVQRLDQEWLKKHMEKQPKQ